MASVFILYFHSCLICLACHQHSTTSCLYLHALLTACIGVDESYIFVVVFNYIAKTHSSLKSGGVIRNIAIDLNYCHQLLENYFLGHFNST